MSEQQGNQSNVDPYQVGDDAPFVYTDPTLPYAASEVPDTTPPARLTKGQWAWRLILCAFVGVAVGAIGTTLQRTLWGNVPIGLIVALVMTFSAALMLRAWRGLPCLLAGAIGWIVITQVMALETAGGDVLIVDPGANIPLAWTGIAWLYAGLALWGVVAFLPRRWFER